MDQGNAVNSPAVRHFKAGMILDYGFVIYNAKITKGDNHPRLTTQVRLFHGSTTVFSGKENPYTSNNPPDLLRLTAGGEIQLGTDLAPGDYVLQIIVNDLNADEKHRTASQWMDFEIVP